MFGLRPKWKSEKDPQALLLLAEQACRASKHKKAMPIYRHLLELDPNNVTARVNLGALLIQLKHDLSEALVHMEYARKQEPENGAVMLNLGSLYTHLGMPERSETILKELIEKYPKFPDARFLLSYHFINRGEIDEARRLLAEELSPGVKPGNMQAKILLAQLNEHRSKKLPEEKS
jgi:predicted Zn-dependent protease